MRAVLVTGASGFVGREVVRQLLEAGARVTGLARHHTGLNIDFVEADLSCPGSLEAALGSRSFDCILHLASCAGDTGNPQEMLAVNVTGCLNVLEYARRRHCPRVVLASSISAYEWYPGTPFNPPDYMPVDEEHPCRPRDMYSVTKRMQELLAVTYFQQYGVGAVALRLTAVIGPRGRGGGRSWRKFAQSLAEGRCVQVPHFSSEEVCHYVDLRDAARMLVVAAEHPRAPGEIFNCAGPASTSGLEFVQAVQTLYPKIQVEYGYPWSMAQGHAISFSMSKAKQLLDFEPRFTLLDSLRNIQEWIEGVGTEDLRDVADGEYAAGVVAD